MKNLHSPLTLNLQSSFGTLLLPASELDDDKFFQSIPFKIIPYLLSIRPTRHLLKLLNHFEINNMMLITMMMAASSTSPSSSSSDVKKQKQLMATTSKLARSASGAETSDISSSAGQLLVNCKGSNSSNETVIAVELVESSSSKSASNGELAIAEQKSEKRLDLNGNKMVVEKEVPTINANEEAAAAAAAYEKQSVRNKFFKNLLIFTTHHLNPFHQSSNFRRKSSISDLLQTNGGSNSAAEQQQQQQQDPAKPSNSAASSSAFHLNLLNFAHKYFSKRNYSPPSTVISKSAPVTPIKGNHLNPNNVSGGGGSTTAPLGPQKSGETAAQAESCITANLNKSVRFVENIQQLSGSSNKPKFATVDCASQTGSGLIDDDSEPTPSGDDDDSVNVVAKLFRLPNDKSELAKGECPMSSGKFRQYGYNLIDYISNYLDTINKRRVTPLNIEPGYLKSLIQASAPEKGESFAHIMHDFENHIMCGITHWQHPHFHAYFPAGNAYPSILADMLSDALGCVGFSWAASPAYTELEIIMLDWMGKMIGLPDEFLCLTSAENEDNATDSDGESSSSKSKGGGVIQGSASECVLVNLLAARHWAIEKLRKKYPNTSEGVLLSKLIGYCSKEAHSCVEKAAMIGFIRMRALDTDDKHSLRGEQLTQAIKEDLAVGLEPFLICATLGTTSCVSFDNLDELGSIALEYDLWLHVDAAYAGSALICPEFKYLMKGIEKATSFNMNPNKWMLINFDCSLMWVKDRFKLTRAFVVDPLYLQHSYSDQAIDYRHWGIPLSRRFRALKLWFVIRNYGLEGLQSYIRNHVRLAKLFESLIRNDSRFSINNQVILGLVCFRLIGSNALNQRLLSMINASGKLHMVPASLNGRYVIRFCVCDQNAREEDIHYAYKCISEFATELMDLIKSGRERIRAVSQQNTIDISSISLHTQQSASAEKLSPPADGQSAAAEVGPGSPSATPAAASSMPVSPREAARQYLLATKHNTDLSRNKSPPLVKQVSLIAGAAAAKELEENLEDLELEDIKLDSLATIDGYDDDLYDDDLEPPMFPDQNQAGNDALTKAKGDQNEEEAADEVFNLNKRKNRMSLRYKREFFVRVVSDPRVYRASISGDINARASSSSLSASQHQTSVPNSSLNSAAKQQQPNQLNNSGEAKE